MKKIIALIILLIIFILTLVFHNNIVNFILDHFTNIKREATVLKNNEYATNNSYSYVKLTDDFTPKNAQDIMNIYYTIIQSGMDEFTFYCDEKYKDCIEDVNYISNNQRVLSYINNFVPSFNSFKNIETSFDSIGKVTVRIIHTYSPDDIKEIDKKIDEVFRENITEDLTIEEKIKKLHDYIINHTKYDIDRSDNKINKYHSDTAYGPLFEGYAICGGYADSMQLFLNKLNLPNFKVTSENHIWNVVLLNDKWYHIDLTWDDPVVNTGEDVLEYNYFLISTEELQELEQEQHIFDIDVYKELKAA